MIGARRWVKATDLDEAKQKAQDYIERKVDR